MDNVKPNSTTIQREIKHIKQRQHEARFVLSFCPEQACSEGLPVKTGKMWPQRGDKEEHHV